VAVLEIVRIGEPVLRAVAEPVGDDELATPGFQRFLDDLVETMRAANGAGLAAPQVGISRRVFCVEVHDNPRYPYKPDLELRVLVNPVVRPLSDERFSSYEGCLSVPDLRGLLPRFLEVEVAYTDRAGNRVVEQIRGLSAGTFQHEQDHLDGILFVDRVEDTRTLTTWDGFRRHREAAFAAEARAIVERWGA
jgi:peptide deformylase